MKASRTLPIRRKGTWRALWAVLAATWLGTVTGAHGTEMAMTEVVAIEGAEIVFGAGRQAGLDVDAEVNLLREGEPIIHPLTGEVLGVPQEPVGTVLVTRASQDGARGVLEKTYSEPQVGDLAEYRPMQPRPSEPALEVRTVMKEVETLREHVAEVREHEQDMRSYPAFSRKVWDEVSAMRKYLTSIDQRLVELEEQQSEDHFRLSSVLSGEYQRDNYKEFTVRYAPDTQVRLRAAGKTLTIDVVGDTLDMTPLTAAPASMSEPPGSLTSGLMDMFRGDAGDDGATPVADVSAEGDEPWYISTYHLAAGVGLTLALLIMVFLVVKRRYADVMDGLDDFEDDYDSYLEDEDDDDE